MSRIGKQPIDIPSGVTVTVNAGVANVAGPKASLNLTIPIQTKVEVIENQVIVTSLSPSKQSKANHGSIRAHLNNMIIGVVTPWTKELEIRGTGYKASVTGNKLNILAGFIHPVVITAPDGVQFLVAEDTKITVTGSDKVKVGQAASNIHKVKKPEPYKGKGIRYLGEVIKLKAGKTAKA